MRLDFIYLLALVERVFAVSDRPQLFLLICAVNEHLFAVDQQNAGNVGIGEDPSRSGNVVFDEVFLHSLTLLGLLDKKMLTVFGVIFTS